MASTSLTRAITGSNRQTWTVSMWVKRSGLSQPGVSGDRLFSGYASSSFWSDIYFGSQDTLEYANISSGSLTEGYINTNRKFRDTNAWYHIVIRYDTTQATASDRIRIYVNGEQETSFSSSTYPSQNYNSAQINSATFYIGQDPNDDFNGLMSHIHFCDGQSYAPTAFGQTDANGVWTIKTSPSVTYGTNGFFILKDGNSVTDQSGNGNNFTVASGTLTNTEDNPSNVFATFNPLAKGVDVGLQQGNTRSANNRTTDSGNVSADVVSTLAASSGKYYAEFKLTNTDNYAAVGVVNSNFYPFATARGYGYSDGVAYRDLDGNKYVDGTDSSYGADYGAGDIVGIALNLDDNQITFYKNGVSQGAISKTFSGSYYFFTSRIIAGSNTVWEANFGNGYFGTTAVASAGTNASGIGIFEYDVPTGYTALSTKGLNL